MSVSRTLSAVAVLAVVFSSQSLAGEMTTARPVAYQAAYQEEPHPLNDAWLGVGAFTLDNIRIGTVVDAFVAGDGSIEQIVIDFDTPRFSVGVAQVPGRLATLEYDRARIGLTLAGLLEKSGDE